MRLRVFLRSLGLLQSALLIHLSSARQWTDIVAPYNLKVQDYNLGNVIFEEDPFLSIETDTQPPIPDATQVPVPAPTNANSPPPTLDRTPIPTLPPAPEPSQSPTASPTVVQTPSPTIDNYPENPVPANPPSNYFNYDTRRSNPYGPGYPQLQRYNESTLAVGYENNGWANTDVAQDWYWNEFDDPPTGFGPWQGILARREPERNRCKNIGEQSPIDVRPSGAKCVEHHEVRSRPGDFKVVGSEVEKLIEPNKLRLKYQRRPCADLADTAILEYTEECSEPDPPHADFPNNWGGYIDLMHIDFKVPSEHMIEGKRYDGEMQIYHLHPGRKRTPTVTVMMEAKPNGFNYYLQPALDAFQYTYNTHRAQCSAKKRRERRYLRDMHQLLGDKNNTQSSTTATDFNTWAEYSTDLDDPNFKKNRALKERLLQYGVWDPHHVELVPSIHFYGYDGSLTEPPCGEWVSWFVCDKPMTISTKQLEQMKTLLFTHVDGDCNPTSVHYRQSVARPIQDSGGRAVWHCTSDDFLADDFTP